MLGPLFHSLALGVLLPVLPDDREGISLKHWLPSNLLNEYRNSLPPCNLDQRLRPFERERTSTWSRFATDDHPVNARQVNLPQVLQQWFDRKKPSAHRRRAKNVDTRNTIFAVLDADSP